MQEEVAVEHHEVKSAGIERVVRGGLAEEFQRLRLRGVIHVMVAQDVIPRAVELLPQPQTLARRRSRMTEVAHLHNHVGRFGSDLGHEGLQTLQGVRLKAVVQVRDHPHAQRLATGPSDFDGRA